MRTVQECKGDALVMEHLTFDSVFLMNQKQIGNDLSLHELVHVLSKALKKYLSSNFLSELCSGTFTIRYMYQI